MNDKRSGPRKEGDREERAHTQKNIEERAYHIYYFSPPFSLSLSLPFAPCSVTRTRTRARLQNHNSVYISDDKPSPDNVIALIIRRGCGGYHLLITSPQHPSDAHPATSHRTVKPRRANTTRRRQPFFLIHSRHSDSLSSTSSFL